MSEKKLCVGVIGAGMISDIYLQNMSEKFHNLYVKSIAAAHPERAEKKAAQYHIQATSVEQMLSDPEIDMVVNLTPAFAHYDVIKNALLHGKHVYTEKTITDHLEQSAELLALAEEKGLYFGSAPDTFLGASLQTARAAIDAGILGEINSFAISANRCNDILIPAFDILRKPGGGIVLDYAVYYVTALVSLLGPVAQVGSVVRTPYKTRKNNNPRSPAFGEIMDTPNESQISALIQMESGVTGTLHMDAETVFEDKAYFVLYGTKGMLYLTDPNQFGGTVKFLPQGKTWSGPVEPIELWSLAKYSENSRGVGPDDMARAILDGTQFRPTARMAYHVHEVLDAILRGGERGGLSAISSTCSRPEPLPQRAVPITRLAHAGFNAHNMEAMMHFYETVLGMQPLFTLTVGEGFGNGDPRKWIEYLKLADGEFVELFYHLDGLQPEKTFVENRWNNYGYLKLNYEVDDIYKLRQRLVDNGIQLDEDIHKTVDGSLEIIVHDPDGNEVQFTQYATDGRLPIDKTTENSSCSAVTHVTQVAYQVRDEVNMYLFYTRGLNLKHAGRLTFGDLADSVEKTGAAGETLAKLRQYADKPWIDYIEVAPHQYIELFYTMEEKKQELRDLNDRYGYQHLCIEVSDIRQAWDAVCENGLVPDTPITLGCEGTYQFWLTDPDGNRMELQQYTRASKQLL